MKVYSPLYGKAKSQFLALGNPHFHNFILLAL
jgi:hypothetical protein